MKRSKQRKIRRALFLYMLLCLKTIIPAQVPQNGIPAGFEIPRCAGTVCRREQKPQNEQLVSIIEESEKERDNSFSTDKTGDENASEQNGGFITENTMPALSNSVIEAEHDHVIRKLSAFSLCYRKTYSQSEWAAYILTKDSLAKNAARTNRFKTDTEIDGYSASPDMYAKTGYDRGHLVPAADMRGNSTSMNESFLMSNISPQLPRFNRGIWRKTEDAGRQWADFFGCVYIVTGPLLENPPESYETIGKDKRISIPEYFYKIFLARMPDGCGTADETADDALCGNTEKPAPANNADGTHQKDAAAATDGSAAVNEENPPTQSINRTANWNRFKAGGTEWYVCAFIIPQNASPQEEYTAFCVSIDEIEARTGIDFFPLLDDKTEQIVESFVWNELPYSETE
ncbi:MAG: DNA/RNA non-specific endonuclease [Bacteroides sp.]|nr:DNA/RNA non-specific endonuclease [Prevotella sp.]MCM1407463.1 DNA/RNA non-specific endonuclease [Treponema brennaborense]MCM1469953.1 DNA/RNA non-specific endonuclease [Bacteroides sp.]